MTRPVRYDLDTTDPTLAGFVQTASVPSGSHCAVNVAQ